MGKDAAYYRAYYAENKEKVEEKRRRWYEKNRESVYARQRQWRADNRVRLKAEKYGTTVEHMGKVLSCQACEICGTVFDESAAGRLHIDHDHGSGDVRGALCGHCNRGLGAFRDDPEALKNAILYLEKHQ